MCKSDQEIINNYLAKNPLKAKQKKAGRWYPKCIACGKPVTSLKKTPCTTHSGEMNSKFTDRVENFPRHEEEDLCATCKSKVRFLNREGSEDYNTNDDELLEKWEKYIEDDPKYSVSFFTENLDGDYLVVENQYQGYSDFESLEGVYSNGGSSGYDKPLKFD